MPSNTTLNLGSGGDVIATKQRTHDGDTALQQVVTIAGVSGTEDAYTYADIDGSVANGLEVDVTRVSGNVIVVGAAAEDAAVSGNPVLAGGRYDSTSRVLETGDVGALAVNAAGELIVDVSATTGGTHVDDAPFTVGTDDGVPTFCMFDDTGPDSVNEGDAGIIRMSANRSQYMQIRDASGIEVGANVSSAGSLQVDGSASTQPVSAASLPLPAGAATSALQLADGHNVTIDNASAGAAVNIQDGGNSITVDGIVNISGAHTTGGATPYRNVDVDETEDAIKASAGQIYFIHCMNLTATTLYLQLYDATVATVVVGTTTATLTFPVPTLGDTNGAGFVLSIPNGIAFGTAITIAATTSIAGAAGPAANGCIVNAGYA